MSCKRADAAIESFGATVRETVNANKDKIDQEQGLRLLQEGSKVLVARGKKVLEFRLKKGQPQGELSLQDLQKAAIGPSGRLRAPTLKLGKTWVVGFNPGLYEEIFASG